VRVAARCAVYLAYDAAAASGLACRDEARVLKVLFELGIDEFSPPPARHEMSYGRCFAEYLAPCGFSSLAGFLLRTVRRSQAASAAGAAGVEASATMGRALWVVAHRILRQALICRLFFRPWSKRYHAATLLGVVCCFFRESLFAELLVFRRWPAHFCYTQGGYAILRTLAYSAAFLLPLNRWSEVFAAAQRRSNVKKLIFSLSLANAAKMRDLLASVIASAGSVLNLY
jgi:hypothetical protein